MNVATALARFGTCIVTVHAVAGALGNQGGTRVLEPDGPPERRRLHRADRGGAADRRLAGGRSQERECGDRRNREQPGT